MAEQIKQRISLEGAEEVKRQLSDIGKEGETAFKKLEDATRSSTTSRLADSLNNVRSSLLGVSSSASETSSSLGSVEAQTKRTEAVSLAFGNALYQSNAALGSLVTVLVASAAAFTTFGASAASSLQKVISAAESVGQTPGKFQNLQSAFASITGSGDKFASGLQRIDNAIGEIAIESARSISKTDNLFKNLGVTVEKVGGSLRTTYQNGVTVIRTVGDKTNDASAATTKFAKDLQDLGIGLANNNGKLKDASTLYQEIARKIAALPDGPARRNLLEKLLPELANPGDLEAFVTELDKRQALFSKLFGSITKEQADTVKQVGEAQNTLRETVSRLIQFIGVQFAGQALAALNATQAAVERFVEFLRTNEGEKFIKTIADGILTFVKAIGDGLVNVVIPAFQALYSAAAGVASFINRVFGTETTAGVVLFVAAIAQMTGVFSALIAVGGVFASILGGPLVAGLVAAGAAIATLVAFAPELGQLFNSLVKFGVDAFTRLIESAKEFGSKIAEAFTLGLTALIDGVSSIANQVLSYLQSLYNRAIAIAQAIASAIRSAFSSRGSVEETNAAGPAGDPGGFATGGYVRGRGTATSDSILARLSNGEFVVRAAAVRKFGPAFFAALNNLRLPQFASGGLVNALSMPSLSLAPSFELPGSGPALRPLAVTIGGQTFDMMAPEDTAQSLMRFATTRQVRSNGRKPSWHGG